MTGDPIVIDGLRGLAFGVKFNDKATKEKGDFTDLLYFTAGIDSEAHGLFGFIRTARNGDF